MDGGADEDDDPDGGGLPTRIPAGVTFDEESFALRYVLPLPAICATDMGVKPLDLMSGYASIKACTDWSLDSCSRTMRPGVLGPAGDDQQVASRQSEK